MVIHRFCLQNIFSTDLDKRPVDVHDPRFLEFPQNFHGSKNFVNIMVIIMTITRLPCALNEKLIPSLETLLCAHLKIHARKMYDAREKKVLFVVIIALMRATPRVERAYFGNKKFFRVTGCTTAVWSTRAR